MESEIFDDFRMTIIDGEYWIVANSEERKDLDLKVAKIASHIRHPKSVAIAIVEGLSNNKRLRLVDLI